MTGRLIGVVGPSGAGKDTLIQALTDVCPDLGCIRRVITRAPGLGGEIYVAVTEDEFARRQRASAFSISWQAHGMHYGIPQDVRQRVASGEQLLVNLSRSVLSEAAKVFPGLTVLNVMASPETLSKRLVNRRRETEHEIARRLKRTTLPLPTNLKIIDVDNDGALDDTVADVLARLYPVRA